MGAVRWWNKQPAPSTPLGLASRWHDASSPALSASSTSSIQHSSCCRGSRVAGRRVHEQQSGIRQRVVSLVEVVCKGVGLPPYIGQCHRACASRWRKRVCEQWRQRQRAGWEAGRLGDAQPGTRVRGQQGRGIYTLEATLWRRTDRWVWALGVDS